MLRVIVVDDEPAARRGLKRLLSAHADLEVIGEAGDLPHARALICDKCPDVIFLDVELSDGHGFELMGDDDHMPAVIFVTAHDLYAVRAFDVAAFDFLLKPVEPERLGVSLDRLRRKLAGAAQDKALSAPRKDVDRVNAPPSQGERIYFKASGQSVITTSDQIVMLMAEADFTRVFLADSREYFVGKLLRYFEEELPNPPFMRVSRSLVINLDHVAAVEWSAGGRSRVLLGDAFEPLFLGRTATKRIRGFLSGFPEFT